MFKAEIDNLPDPDLFRDAKFLAEHGTFAPRDLDEMDVQLLALVRRFLDVRKG